MNEHAPPSLRMRRAKQTTSMTIGHSKPTKFMLACASNKFRGRGEFELHADIMADKAAVLCWCQSRLFKITHTVWTRTKNELLIYHLFRDACRMRGVYMHAFLLRVTRNPHWYYVFATPSKGRRQQVCLRAWVAWRFTIGTVLIRRYFLRPLISALVELTQPSNCVRRIMLDMICDNSKLNLMMCNIKHRYYNVILLKTILYLMVTFILKHY